MHRPQSIRLRGRDFSTDEIGLIGQVVEELRSASRTQISQEVCRRLDWRQPNGWLKERACRDVLLRLEQDGIVKLPERLVIPNNRARSQRSGRATLSCTVDDSPLCALDLSGVDLELVRGDERERLWNALVSSYHYLGFDVFVGRSMKYLIVADDRPLGAVGWCDPSWAIAARDRMLMSCGLTRDEIRTRGINNGRLLILPWVTVKNLASNVLGKAVRAVQRDWADFYSVRPAYLETYIDMSRYAGTCYRAANWVEIGRSRGFRKHGATHSNSQAPKALLLYPLQRTVREAAHAIRCQRKETQL